jgi:hypothetical protein
VIRTVRPGDVPCLACLHLGIRNAPNSNKNILRILATLSALAYNFNAVFHCVRFPIADALWWCIMMINIIIIMSLCSWVLLHLKLKREAAYSPTCPTPPRVSVTCFIVPNRKYSLWKFAAICTVKYATQKLRKMWRYFLPTSLLLHSSFLRSFFLSLPLSSFLDFLNCHVV